MLMLRHGHWSVARAGVNCKAALVFKPEPTTLGHDFELTNCISPRH